ncbi:hypothetical protein EV191_12827 [Tamaricihabitans halophyticus]|uniref:ATP-grasp domain-containing protein n=1 Tax=Tamaricihabitans halophyticus TaxID=1262583 RepID=A0A4R2PXK0_9PSEU|nr:hypothetical protein [Tamaricihabitans halophyticus]TCP40777.1 hypothetical protein EV191_12827 [Tamaricihabitans halophyticus]
MTPAVVDDKLHSIRSADTLYECGVAIDAVRDIVLRIVRLAELVPEIAELDLNPLSRRTGAGSCWTPGSQRRRLGASVGVPSKINAPGGI